MSQQVVIPKDWKKVKGHCFIDKNGDAHIRLKEEYKTSSNNRKYSLQYAKTHRKKSNETSTKWKLENPKKVKKLRKKNNKLYAECIKLVKKLKSRENRKKIKAKKNDKKSPNCEEYHHGRCTKKLCVCKCHKNT